MKRGLLPVWPGNLLGRPKLQPLALGNLVLQGPPLAGQ